MPIPLQEKDYTALSKAFICSTQTLNLFGDVPDRFQQLTAFFLKQGNAPDAALEQATVLSRMIDNIVDQSNAETAWVSVRASMPTDIYDQPRWHSDAAYYDLDADVINEQYKILVPLKGAATLFGAVSDEKREHFMALQKDDGTLSDEIRMEQRILRTTLVDDETVTTTPTHMATVIIAGTENAAVHSEPPIHDPRLFVSILPATHEQIREMQERWNVASKNVLEKGTLQSPTTMLAEAFKRMGLLDEDFCFRAC